MCDETTPVYDRTCDELLTNPETVTRRLDELLIEWYTTWLREHPLGEHPPDDG